MRDYEVMFVLDMDLDDAAREAAIEMVKDVIAADGEVGKIDIWGMRKLAYPIMKKPEGFYVVIEFKANSELPKELSRKLRISDACVRHIIVNK